jgi:hypothetical protein
MGLIVFTIRLAATPRAVDESKRFDVGGYQVDVVLGNDWHSKINKQGGYLVLTNPAEADSDGEVAVLGVFRIVIPVAVRGADKTEIATAYAVQDVAGVRKALFGSIAALKLLTRKPRDFHQGALFEFDEPIELVHGRELSTKFVRAYVFFPPGYSQDGGLFLLVGLQQFSHPRVRADAFDKLENIVAGLHSPAQ